jgi:hypothetical protein
MEEAVSSDTTNKLEQLVAAALANGHAGSEALTELITAASTAAEAAEQAATAARERALDVVASPDVGAAHAAVAAAELVRDRLAATLPRLRARLTEALAAEHHARWFSDYLRVEKLRNQAAEKFARQCPELLANLIGLFRESDAVDQECLRVNANAPANEPRRLVAVELHARGMNTFTASQPSLSATIRLPDYQRSDQVAWPVLRPNDFAVAVAESMKPPRDIRYSADWWQAAEADAAERRLLAERRAADQQAADAARRAEYERSLQQQEKERERRAHKRRRG